MKPPAVVSREKWLEARKALLEDEKMFLRARDELSARRRALPWVRVEEEYVFEGADGAVTLGNLFGDKSQLIVQHFMFGPDWEEGCPSCSFWGDSFDGNSVHLAHRDAAFVAISNAPIGKLLAYRKRMGWDFNWVSSQGTRFNSDYHVSFTEDEMAAGPVTYNFRETSNVMGELPGISIFVRDDGGDIYHTYSCYARGLDNMNSAYQLLDLTPKGRDETGLEYTMAWVRRHDQYED